MTKATGRPRGRPPGSRNKADTVAAAAAKLANGKALIRTAEQRAEKLIETLDLGIDRAAQVIAKGTPMESMAAFRAISVLAVASLEAQQRERERHAERSETDSAATDLFWAKMETARQGHLRRMERENIDGDGRATGPAPAGGAGGDQGAAWTWDGFATAARGLPPVAGHAGLVDVAAVTVDADPDPAPAAAVTEPEIPSVSTGPVPPDPEPVAAVDTLAGKLVTALPGHARGSGVPPRHQPVPTDLLRMPTRQHWAR